MKIQYHNDKNKWNDASVKIIASYSAKQEKTDLAKMKGWPLDILDEFKQIKMKGLFSAQKEEIFSFTTGKGELVYLIGLGEEKSATKETIRRACATLIKKIPTKAIKELEINIDTFTGKLKQADIVSAIAESVPLALYKFDKYFSKKSNLKLELLSIFCTNKNKSIAKILQNAKETTESINYARELVNEAPNHLTSVSMAKAIENDVKKNLPKVKVKILNKADIKKEKMNLVLAVNAGSQFEPRVVHLTYTPPKSSKRSKHIALVGKGLTFDTGGYSLKPSSSIANMKYDMGGAATVYGAFRAAVLMGSPNKISCIIPMTDNCVDAKAILPDSIVTARSGKSVEILNTDAEGRLILADALDYTCDLNPDRIIDAATLTGACLVALGSEVCAVMGNDDKFTQKLIEHSKIRDELLWELPIIDEWRKDMKSKNADLKNIGGSRFGGTGKAAAFLEEFIKNDISWAHFDIAGVCDSQAWLPYCPAHGASGLIVRTLADYLCSKNV